MQLNTVIPKNNMTLDLYLFKLTTDKPRKQPIRRTNGQVARKIPVKEGNKIVSYIYL